MKTFFLLLRLDWDKDMNPNAVATNWLTRIAIKTNLAFGDCILAQEERERQYKLVRVGIANAIGQPLTVLIPTVLLPGEEIAVMFMMLASFTIAAASRGYASRTSKLEIVGRAVEWRAAVRFREQSYETYLWNVAWQLHNSPNYYKAFKDASFYETTDRLRAQQRAADKWLDKHWDNIKERWDSRPLKQENV